MFFVGKKFYKALHEHSLWYVEHIDKILHGEHGSQTLFHNGSYEV